VAQRSASSGVVGQGRDALTGLGALKRRFGAPGWLLAPAALLYGLMALGPLIVILQMSFSQGFGAYERVLTDPLLRPILVNTVVISTQTTLVALLLGYYLAATIWRSGPRVRMVLLALILLPFWTSGLVKNFAWSALLQDRGLINHGLQALGLTHRPLTLLHNRFAVILGMVHYVLPFAVFPIYSVMLSIDRSLERAALSLGASAAETLWRITLPLTRPGVYAGGLITFIVSTSFYLTPVILGSQKDMMIANLIDAYTHETVDFAAAAALAVVMMLAVSGLFALYQRLPKESQFGRF
jgi:ABC-type spermidine/putrescine transport system permease subunit I